VLKITNAAPGLTPPQVETGGAEWVASTGTMMLHGKLTSLGNAPEVEVGFQYREKKGGTDLSERTEPWSDLPASARTGSGEFSYALTGIAVGRTYEYRARVRHPLITMYGPEKTFTAR
jgi:alpha-L-fucosidase